MTTPYNFYDIIKQTQSRGSQDQPYLSDSYTDLIKRLCLCAPRIGNGEESFGAVMFEVLSKDILFSQIDRICLAERVLGSNQLLILDCFLNPECGENKMKPGYSCYVDPNSSLFKMENGQFRVYTDQLSIIDSYAKDEKPLQRSIRKIFSMGMQGGLAIPLSFRKSPYAFVFLNTRSSTLFKDLQIEDYLVLNYITGLATQAYNVLKRIESAAPELTGVSARSFTSEDLCSEIVTNVGTIQRDPSYKPLNEEVLLNPNVISNLLSAIRIACHIKTITKYPTFSLELDDHSERFAITLHFPEREAARVFYEILRQVLTLSTVDMGLLSERIVVSTHSESRFYGTEDRFYSV